MSKPVVAIGYIILTPSIIAVIIFASAIFRASSLQSEMGDDANTAVIGLLVFFGIVSFVAGLLGWLLVMKKSVLRCNKCGAIVPAS